MNIGILTCRWGKMPIIIGERQEFLLGRLGVGRTGLIPEGGDRRLSD
jgi:hypothetical protein